ncbi:GIY-YIG nuclease family protein [Romboutsia ilealis]|uniref:GIY-YIG nuclease family protein n=1 Tax=Romboutsia ilealis TaxID=1115758 RepID=UPI00272997ED|nr:GIY-YIG nuclease family protein [Romboutsia ilealis]
MIYGIIYKITDKENGKVYIGQTTDYKRRIRDYKYSPSKIKCYGYDNCNTITKMFYDKGFNNFKFNVIDAGDSPEELVDLENYWINYYNSIEEGYNDYKATIQYKMSEISKSKLRRQAGNFRHKAETIKKKSIPIIAYKDGVFKRYPSAKLFAEIHNTERTYVSRATKHGKTVLGYNIFYCDKNLREEVYLKSKDNKYKKLYESIKEDLETIENGKMYIDIF